jgi:ribonuclease E
LRQGMLEGSTKVCPHCEGRGIIRSVSSCALSVLRQIEDQLTGRRAENLTVHCHREIATYILNEKREHLLAIEGAYGISIFIVPSDSVKAAEAVIERGAERAVPVRRKFEPVKLAPGEEEQAEDISIEEDEDESDAEDDGENGETRDRGPVELDENGEPRRKRRRRRGRRGGRRNREEGELSAEEDGQANGPRGEDGEAEASDGDDAADSSGWDSEIEAAEQHLGGEAGPNGERGKRRRRRGGRNRRGRGEREAGSGSEFPAEADDTGTSFGSVTDTDGMTDGSRPAQAEAPTPAPSISEPDRVSAPGPAATSEAEEAARRWQPPAPTVDPETVPRKSGWWSKR